MEIIPPNGLVERMEDRRERTMQPMGYGRQKHGAPMNAESWRIADSNDRRDRQRLGTDPFRGRLIDLDV